MGSVVDLGRECGEEVGGFLGDIRSVTEGTLEIDGVVTMGLMRGFTCVAFWWCRWPVRHSCAGHFFGVYGI